MATEFMNDMIPFEYVNDNKEIGIFLLGMKSVFYFTKPPVQEMSFVLIQQLLDLKCVIHRHPFNYTGCL